MSNGEKKQIVTILGAAAWLLYWTGRWYKECYFFQFGINYETLGFDTPYYLFASWATVITAISGLMIVFSVFISLYLNGCWGKKIIPWLIFGIAIFYLLPLKIIHYNPLGSPLNRLLGSRDTVINILGIFASVFILKYFNKRNGVNISFDIIYDSLKRHFTNNLTLSFLASLLFVWLYLLIVGNLLGTYHGKAAYREGRMGLRWVTVMNDTVIIQSDSTRIKTKYVVIQRDALLKRYQPMILVVRTQDGRNYLFDRKTMRGEYVKDDLIIRIDSLVGPEL